MNYTINKFLLYYYDRVDVSEGTDSLSFLGFFK